jgi:hypothetical protein
MVNNVFDPIVGTGLAYGVFGFLRELLELEMKDVHKV